MLFPKFPAPTPFRDGFKLHFRMKGYFSVKYFSRQIFLEIVKNIKPNVKLYSYKKKCVFKILETKEISRRKFVRGVFQLKDNIADNPVAPVKRVYDETISNIRRQDNAPNPEDIPVFEEFIGTLKRKKYENEPPIPQDVADVAIEGVRSETWTETDNLMHLDKDWGIVIFGTEKTLRLLQRATVIYAGGTFRTAPHLYKQVFTIHANVRGHVVLAVTCLMLNKDIGSYRQVLQALNTKIWQLTGHRWRPATLILDFELASTNAFPTEFRYITVKGCATFTVTKLCGKFKDLSSRTRTETIGG